MNESYITMFLLKKKEVELDEDGLIGHELHLAAICPLGFGYDKVRCARKSFLIFF